MRIAGFLVGLLLLLLGGVWMLQGSNVVLGSVMSGQPLWLFIGGAVVAAGLGLMWFALPAGKR